MRKKREPKPPYDPMDEIVECPMCKKEVREGDRIWLNGMATCFECYRSRYEEYYKKPYKWDIEGNLLPEYREEEK